MINRAVPAQHSRKGKLVSSAVERSICGVVQTRKACRNLIMAKWTELAKIWYIVVLTNLCAS